MTTDLIHVKDLLLRTIIGINDDERRNKQDVLINITLQADHSTAASDDIKDTVNYRTITTIDSVAKSTTFQKICCPQTGLGTLIPEGETATTTDVKNN